MSKPIREGLKRISPDEGNELAHLSFVRCEAIFLSHFPLLRDS